MGGKLTKEEKLFRAHLKKENTEDAKAVYKAITSRPLKPWNNGHILVFGGKESLKVPTYNYFIVVDLDSEEMRWDYRRVKETQDERPENLDLAEWKDYDDPDLALLLLSGNLWEILHADGFGGIITYDLMLAIFALGGDKTFSKFSEVNGDVEELATFLCAEKEEDKMKKESLDKEDEDSSSDASSQE